MPEKAQFTHERVEYNFFLFDVNVLLAPRRTSVFLENKKLKKPSTETIPEKLS
jgi:hypothetical protein